MMRLDTIYLNLGIKLQSMIQLEDILLLSKVDENCSCHAI